MIDFKDLLLKKETTLSKAWKSRDFKTLYDMLIKYNKTAEIEGIPEGTDLKKLYSDLISLQLKYCATKDYDVEDKLTSYFKGGVIPEEGLANVSWIGSVYADPKLTTIEKAGFEGSSITEFHCLSSLSRLGSGAFANCKNLKNVDLKLAKFEVLQNNMFLNCTNLKTVILPATLKEIWGTAFDNVPSTVKIYVPFNPDGEQIKVGKSDIGFFKATLVPYTIKSNVSTEADAETAEQDAVDDEPDNSFDFGY